MGDSKKIAAYICRGCDIGSALDIDALRKVAEDEYSLEVVRDHECLCSEEGVEAIAKDVGDGADAVVIAACSPRAMAEVFRFDCLTERVNLREHVVWSHEPNDEDTQMLAEDYLRMGIVKAQKASRPEPHKDEVSQAVMVVGGGVSGLKAALETAATGHDVTLVEKDSQLGGWMARFPAAFPKRPPYRDLQPTGVKELIARVEQHERIEVLTSAKIESITGQPGQFDVKLSAGGAAKEFRTGAIVQATGWKPYDATKLGHLGYGASPDVVTNVELEDMVREWGEIKRPSDGKPAKRVAFVQCAGSRDKEHLPYCSAVCCRVSLKQALYVRERNPESEVYILYKDLRSPMQYEDFYRRVQEDPGVFFTKGEVKGVAATNGTLTVDVEDTLLAPKMQLEADLVVLATGMVPVSADGERIRQLTDAKAIIAKGEAGAQLEAAKKTAEELKHYEGSNILNLGYRQGPDLPMLRYDFPDSHFICFPYETRRTGIYAAGCMRAPQDSDAAMEDATGAALKAIQSVRKAAGGQAVHPRWGDESYPEFFLQRCTQCKRCTEECPFGTLNEDAKGTPQPNPLRCRRCGICLGACPERIISFKDYSIDIISSMIKAIEIPDEDEEKPRLLGFLCENDAYPALDRAGLKRIKHSAFIRFIPVRCLGSVNVVWIADALSKGFDGILLIGCKSGDDYQCHFIRGSELMGTRSKNIKEKLDQLALEEERVRLEELAINEYERLPAIIEEFAEQIDEVGPNPFKGF